MEVRTAFLSPSLYLVWLCDSSVCCGRNAGRGFGSGDWARDQAACSSVKKLAESCLRARLSAPFGRSPHYASCVFGCRVHYSAGSQGHGTTLWQIDTLKAHTFIQGLSTLFASRHARLKSSLKLFQPYNCAERRRRYRVERRFCCQFRYSTNFHFIPLRLPLQNRDPSKPNAAARTSTPTFTTTPTTPRLLRR